MKLRAAALLLLIATSAAAQTFDLRGFVSGRGESIDGQPSWTRHAFGRFDAGGEGERDVAIGEIQLGFDWRPIQHFDLHVDGMSYGNARSLKGRTGLVTAFAEIVGERGRNEFDLRAGQFFLGTSRENTDDLWTSPYTINFSAINTWIAQEVRPIGIDAEWRVPPGNVRLQTGPGADGRSEIV